MAVRIPADVITETLDIYHPGLPSGSEETSYAKLQLMRKGELAAETLYVGRHTDLPSSRQTVNCGFVCIGQPAVHQDRMVVLPDGCDLYEVFNRLQELFTMLADYEVELMKAASIGSYQDLIDIGYRFAGNPIHLMDSGFRALAATQVDVPGDDEWNYFRRVGAVSPDIIKMLKEKGRPPFEMQRGLQVLVSRLVRHVALFGNTYVNGRFTGRLSIAEAFRPISSVDKLAVMKLLEAVEMKMSVDEQFQHVRGKGPVYNVLHDLLHGVHLDGSLIADRLQYRPSWTKGWFRVLFVPLGSMDDPTFDYFATALEKKADAVSVLFTHALVAILHYPHHGDPESLTHPVTEFLAEHSLRGGLSNEFEALSEIRDYYRQAVTSLELGEGDKFLHLYKDCALKYTLSLISIENTPLVRHPSLLRLRQFDEENGTQLFETLNAYLQNERSLVKAAEALHIHRNTLVYRISKIADVVDLDLESKDLRLHLLVSYRI